MAPSTASTTRRGRRLLAVASVAAALLTSSATLFGGIRVGHAESPAPGVNAEPLCRRAVCPSPTPTDTPASPTPTPNSCQYYPDLCPSPSPTLVVVSPVTPDPSAVPATPAYLVGTAPSPTANADGATVISSPVPVGGGFVDQLPTPSQAAVGPTSDLAPHQGGLPLPFLAVGALLILGAVGSLIYALAPREKPIFKRPPPGSASPVMFTPYGPDTPGTNILSGGQGPRPGPNKPA